MKNFFTSLLATIVGVIISGLILFFLFLIIISAIVSSQNKTVEVKPNSILYLQLDKPIIDRDPESTVNIGQFGVDNRIGLNAILSSIDRAKTDSKIKGIYIESAFIETGYATIDEIRKALIDFRTSGKFVVSYSDIYTQKAYYAATVSDKIFFNPAGMFMLNGLRIKSQFYKNAFDKLGIEPVVVKAGKYKGATESFESDRMSGPNKEQLGELIQSMWSGISEQICEARSIKVDSLNYLIENLQFDSPDVLIKNKLIDSLVYKSDVLAYLKKLTGTPVNEDLSTITVNNYFQSAFKSEFIGASSNKIALIYASGTIYDGEADGENIGSEKFAREIRKARRDSSIKAIVLRVNSPGGSSIASDVILDEILRTRGVKPIVVSMGDMAASGGYYISCSADSVIAGKNTITGSIGVFFRAAYSDGFFDKLGITFDMVKTHEHADMFSFTRPYSLEEIQFLQKSINSTYSLFLNRVSEGRNMEYSAVDEIAQGRVWSGIDAQSIGLVDSFGGLTEAVQAAKKLAGLDRFETVELPRQESTLEKLIKDLSGESKFESTLKSIGFDYSAITDAKQLLSLQGILTVLPYALSIE